MPPSDSFISQALLEAQKAFDEDEIPIGAVIVCGNQIIARAHNTRERDNNPLHHAEIKALQEAARVLGNWRLSDCDLYVTAEPCPMCLGALFQARVGRLFFGCYDDKRDEGLAANIDKKIFPSLKGVPELFGNNHLLKIQGGILEEECAAILKEFFVKRRQDFKPE